MINMIKADFYRIVRSSVIYIGIGLMLTMLGASIYLCEPGTIGININMEGENPVNIEELERPIHSMLESGEITYEEFRDSKVKDLRRVFKKHKGYQLDRDILRVNMNLYYVFLFAAVLIISADFSNATIKNTLSSAISKRKYFVSKLLMTYGLCILIMFANTYLCYFGNLLLNGKNLSSSLGLLTEITIKQIPIMTALVSIISGIAFIVKKTAVFNMIAIPFGLIYSMIFSFALKIFNISPDNMKYEFSSMLSIMAGTPKSDYMIKCYIICAVISVVFIIIGWLSFRKSEIK